MRLLLRDDGDLAGTSPSVIVAASLPAIEDVL
jgi:hypothetical protein